MCSVSFFMLYLDFIYSFSSFQAVKLTTDEKVEEVYNIFNKELKLVKKELNQKSRSFPDHMPQIAGQAHWVTALRHRLERPMEVSLLSYTVMFCLGTG